tara:strand:- start:580 stop:1068 length:489 start_codon:yes stop_codon:yes gene_type:complete
MKYTIATTRFNGKTWYENCKWCEDNNYDGCIYGLPMPIPQKILAEAPIFVLEMHNDNNKIMGIGLIRNRAIFDKRYKIYNDNYYCQYIYKSNYRIDREDITAEQEKMFKILDILVFTGDSHMKRGHGITCMSKKLLKRGKLNFIKHIKQLFLEHYTPPSPLG